MTGNSGFQLKKGGPVVYELYWVRAQMGRCAEELIDAVGVTPGDRVLDIACGTGVVARAAAIRSGAAENVTGTDVNGGMLEAAERFAKDAGLDGITWLESDAAALPLQDNSFDVVLCQQGLQFVPDKSGTMDEMARVLRPGGRFAISVWRTRAPIGAAFAKILDRHFGAGTTAPWEMIYSLGDRDYLHEMALNAGFRDVHVTLDVKFVRHPDPEAFISGALAGSPLAETLANLPVAECERLVREIVAELADYHDDDGLASPAECLTMTARQ